MSNTINNAMTIDVEDYYQVEAFSRVIDRKNWDKYESRVRRNTLKIIDLFDKSNIKATFFILGCVAKDHPEIVRIISEAGHEVASHGFSHKLIYRQTPDEFRYETRESKKILEDIVQKPVIGYRAATYSIVNDSLWALDILLEEDFKYDSSIFPMRHDRYGISDAIMVPHKRETPSGRKITEFPISVLNYHTMKIPVAGGGYFRLFPYWLTRWGLGKINKKGIPFVFYAHPWEIDKNQPVIGNINKITKFRHYNNIDKFEKRMKNLIKDYKFNTMSKVLTDLSLL